MNKLEVDKRLESMTEYISKNVHAFELSQLVSMLQMTVKMRIPSEKLINCLLDEIHKRLIGVKEPMQVNTINLMPVTEAIDERLTVKELAQLVWACGKLRVPKDHEIIPVLRNSSANLVNKYIENRWLFDWDPPHHKTSTIDENIENVSDHGLEELSEQYDGKVETDRLVHL